jgi:peptide deformylase
VPEIFDEVERPSKVKLRYLDYKGETVEEDAEGLYAVCIQHEMDHLKASSSSTTSRASSASRR